MSSSNPLVAYYGDDFTGSTDTLAQFYRFGLTGILLFSCPDIQTLSRLTEGKSVVGIAGISRSLPTEQLCDEVEPVFTTLKHLNSRFMQYKICSTFDSSTEIGSLGRIIEIAQDVYGKEPIPVVAAQPDFGRYTVFGNHFAKFGEDIYRLDCHPTMSKHPVTPMGVANLIHHLQRQTTQPVAGFDIINLSSAKDVATRKYRDILMNNPAAIIFDALEMRHLVRIVELISETGRENSSRFVMGSGGLSYGIGAYANPDSDECIESSLAPVENLLVLSGSASPQTKRQISWALDHGWEGIRVDTLTFLTDGSDVINNVKDQVLSALNDRKNVLVYTALGPDDTYIGKTRNALRLEGIPLHELTRRIGNAFGRFLEMAFRQTHLRRAIVAGGDTSGYAMKAIDAYGLEIANILVPGAAVCKIRSMNDHIDGCEVLLKGGQVGNDDLFEIVRGETK